MRLRALSLATLAVFALATLGPASALADDTPEQARDAFVHDQRNLMTVLGVYSLSSMAVGGAMLASSQPEVRAAGVQNLAWGAIDGAIALIALGKTDFVRGTGGGVLAQGGFLFAFDTSAAFVMAKRR